VPGRAFHDPAGAVLLATGVAAITFGISEAPRFGITDSTTVATHGSPAPVA
jgi:hypothetical protein